MNPEKPGQKEYLVGEVQKALEKQNRSRAEFLSKFYALSRLGKLRGNKEMVREILGYLDEVPAQGTALLRQHPHVHEILRQSIYLHPLFLEGEQDEKLRTALDKINAVPDNNFFELLTKDPSHGVLLHDTASRLRAASLLTVNTTAQDYLAKSFYFEMLNAYRHCHEDPPPKYATLLPAEDRKGQNILERLLAAAGVPKTRTPVQIRFKKHPIYQDLASFDEAVADPRMLIDELIDSPLRPDFFVKK